MKELQELRNEILTLRNYGVINKQEELILLYKLNNLKNKLTLTDIFECILCVDNKDGCLSLTVGNKYIVIK